MNALIHWMIKYKVVHLLLWIIVSFFFLGIDYDESSSLVSQLLSTMVATGLSVPACYFAANQLTPRFLYQKKIRKFMGKLVLLIALNTVITYLIAMSIYHLLTGLPMFRSFTYVRYICCVIFYYNVMLISVSCVAKIIADRYNMEQRLVEVEKERMSTELNFLRSQINPHFLFNIMNTIYFQIDKGNTQARASVEKLSEMLRYQLYECTTDKIEIAKETEYIKNYISMQSLRMEKGTDIQLAMDDSLSGFFIAPLLLLPIIENAFKHISNDREAVKNKIHISMQHQSNEALLVQVRNTFDTTAKEQHLLQSGGLGMQNLQRRLALIYPRRHEFSVQKKGNIFETNLKIIYHDPLPGSR